MSPTHQAANQQAKAEIIANEEEEILQTSVGTGPPQMAEFIFENKWTSGPLKQFSASPEAFENSFSSILTVEIIKQKKLCLNLDWLLFEMEEFQKAGELARQIMEDYVNYNKEMQEVTITYGALEEQVGLWLVDIINNKLI